MINIIKISLSEQIICLNFKVYKAISDCLENGTINCSVFSIVLNYLIFIIKLWMGPVHVETSTKP